MNDRIEEAIKLLRQNGYIIKKWTKRMEDDANECVVMEEQNKEKDCCGCACSICLMQ